MNPTLHIEPDWRWGTPEGSREFDRLTDRMLTFREKLEWLEEAETLALMWQTSRQHRVKPHDENVSPQRSITPAPLRQQSGRGRRS